MPELQIRLFGQFLLLDDGEPVTTLSGDRPQSLLAYLLLQRHAPQSRQHLAFTLWPDSGDAQARTNLRNLLFQVRRALPRADLYLSIGANTVQWRPDAPFTLDVAAFQEALAAAQAVRATATELEWLETAVSLYTGDLFPGNYEDWLLPLREELRQAYLAALVRLVALLEQSEDYRAAMRYAQRQLQIDPLDEAAYVQLMRLHARSGDRAGVRRVYELCASTLQRELGVEPGPATQAAFAQLLRWEAPVAPLQPAAAAPADPVATTPPAAAVAPPCVRILPPQPTPFVGRETELAQIAQLLALPDCRLLTIVGSGGIGKTRLAVQSAQGHAQVFTHGVAFVPLAPVPTADHVATTIAETLSISLSRAGAHQEQLIDHLREREMLLVLDNMEHLVAGSEWLSDLLLAAPQVKLLLTSRQRLNLREEWIYDLRGLPAPDEQDLTTLEENSAAALFLQAARRTWAGFTLTTADRAAVARICRLVDGMPLALELAATWVRLLSCSEIAAEIARNIDFLTASQRNLPERHRSVRAVFEYSWAMLEAHERDAFSRLALFRGGFDRDGAMEVAGATLPLLAALVDKSLVRPQRDGRYDVHELVRQYALERLAEDTAAYSAAQRAHACYCLALADQAREGLGGADASAWTTRLDGEMDNVRAALAWSLSAGETEIALRLCQALWRFWWQCGHLREGLRWLQAGLAQAEAADAAAVARRLLANAYQAAGVLARNLGDYAQARRYHTAGLTLQQAEGNQQGIGASLNSLATLSMFQGAYDEAEAYYNQSLAAYEAAGDRRGAESILNNLGIVAMYQGDVERSLQLHLRSLEVAYETGDRQGIANALGNLGDVYRYLGRFDEADAALDQSLHILQELQNVQGEGTTRYSMGLLALARGRPDEADVQLRRSLALHWQAEDLVAIADDLEGLARVAMARGDAQGTARLYGAADTLRDRTGTPTPSVEWPFHDAARGQAHHQLGTAAFTAAYFTGQTGDLAQIITALLDNPA